MSRKNIKINQDVSLRRHKVAQEWEDSAEDDRDEDIYFGGMNVTALLAAYNPIKHVPDKTGRLYLSDRIEAKSLAAMTNSAVVLDAKRQFQQSALEMLVVPNAAYVITGKQAVKFIFARQAKQVIIQNGSILDTLDINADRVDNIALMGDFPLLKGALLDDGKLAVGIKPVKTKTRDDKQCEHAHFRTPVLNVARGLVYDGGNVMPLSLYAAQNQESVFCSQADQHAWAQNLDFFKTLKPV